MRRHFLKLPRAIWISLFPSLLVFGAALLLFLAPPQPRGGIDRRSYDLIEAGMTQQDVERIIGSPPVNYTTEDSTMLHVDSQRFGPLARLSRPFMLVRWRTYEATIHIGLDEDGKVIWKDFHIDQNVPLTDRVTSWLARPTKSAASPMWIRPPRKRPSQRQKLATPSAEGCERNN